MRRQATDPAAPEVAGGLVRAALSPKRRAYDLGEVVGVALGQRRVAASTITRINGSVPLGRTSTRPSPSSVASAAAISAASSARRRSGWRSATATLTSTCGYEVITEPASSASGRPVARRAARRRPAEQAVAGGRHVADR